MKLTDTDRRALERAVEIARRDPVERARIDRKLSEGADYWRDVAIHCAGHCQRQNLELMPWENPPMYGDITEPRRDEHAFDMLREMLAAGLSRFEPTPLQALKRAKPRRVATTAR